MRPEPRSSGAIDEEALRREFRALQDLHQPPLPALARRLGWAGLLPFAAALAAWAWGLVQQQPDVVVPAQQAFLVYSAVILSFLGGVRWGRVMSAGTPPAGYVLAVLPSLWAFPALFLPPPHAVAALGCGFALALWFDTRADTLPATPGFRRLRLHLSLAVIAAHLLALPLAWRS
ncbi:MAG: DUF3429 domain-containing protein [Xanthomonadaceae bacterium]|jgi:hypothetical protein|nr:DUF3429 domain-containing protein [Xanthomonadaceae bacterium]